MLTRNIQTYAGSAANVWSAAPPPATPSRATPVTLARTTTIIEPSGYDSAANTSVRNSVSAAGLVTPPSK